MSKIRVEEMDDTKKRVVFFHPDLGIGGAERLVVDAAVGLQSLGHDVIIFTSHCDQTHCFDEARDGQPRSHFLRSIKLILAAYY